MLPRYVPHTHYNQCCLSCEVPSVLVQGSDSGSILTMYIRKYVVVTVWNADEHSKFLACGFPPHCKI